MCLKSIVKVLHPTPDHEYQNPHTNRKHHTLGLELAKRIAHIISTSKYVDRYHQKWMRYSGIVRDVGIGLLSPLVIRQSFGLKHRVFIFVYTPKRKNKVGGQEILVKWLDL